MPLIAPLFIEDGEFTSRLTMVSEVNFPVNADVVLFNRQGAQLARQTVVFASHCQRVVEVGDMLKMVRSAETVGTVEVVPDPILGNDMAIAAQLSISGTGASINQHLEEEFMMLDPNGSNTFRAASSALLGQPVLALKSTAMTPQTATVSCLIEIGGNVQAQVQLAPGELALVNGCANAKPKLQLVEDGLHQQELDSRGAFGISAATDGMPGELSVYGFSFRGNKKEDATLSSINFADTGMARSANTVFPGVPVGTTHFLPGSVFQPVLAVSNFGARAAKASVLYAQTGGSGPTARTIAAVVVPPATAQTIALPRLEGDPDLRNSLIVESDALPGTFFSSLASVGGPEFNVIDDIGKDEANAANGGGHPWSVVGGQTAILLLFNQSSAAKYFNVKIGNGGVLWQRSWQLAPMETKAISINALIATGATDETGAVLPKDLAQGEIGWFTPNPTEGTGRLLQVDNIAAIARNFSCTFSYVLCGASLTTDLITFPFASSSSPLDLGPDVPIICTNYNPNACTGNQSSQGADGYSYSWQSNSPSVATVYGSSTSASAAFWGAGPGQGTANGTVSSGTCTFGRQGTTDVIQVQVTTADITADKVSVSLSGPSTASGPLTVTLQGGTNVQLASQTSGPGSYNFTFNRLSLPLAQFNSVGATWTVNGTAASGSKSVSFNTFGLTRFSTYNVPYESQCTGSAGPAFVFTSWSGSTCSYIDTTLNSLFMSQTTTNGTGISISNGILKASAALDYCVLPPGATASQTFYKVTSVTGACNTTLTSGTSIATYPNPLSRTTWLCSDQVLLINSSNQNNSTKIVQDFCPICYTGFSGSSGHIDTYSSSQACSPHAFSDYGNFNAIRLR